MESVRASVAILPVRTTRIGPSLTKTSAARSQKRTSPTCQHGTSHVRIESYPGSHGLVKLFDPPASVDVAPAVNRDEVVRLNFAARTKRPSSMGNFRSCMDRVLVVREHG